MRRALIDDIRKISGDSEGANHAVKRLRTTAWLDGARKLAACPSWPEFDKMYVERGRSRSNLGEKWRKGIVEPSRYSAEKLEDRLPGTLAVFDSPLWVLLENRPFSQSEVAKIMSDYRPQKASDLPFFWLFPNDEVQWKQRRCAPTLSMRDTGGLVHRGDMWGFLALLWTMRYAEADGDQELHHLASEDMYRAMPMAIREPWLADHATTLFELTEAIRARRSYSFYLFDVDFDVIKRQATDPTYEPVREHRPWDARTGRFQEVEDPVLPAHVISGREWSLSARSRPR